MQFLFEFFPVLLFFLAFKFFDIYVATIVGIVSTLFQVSLYRILKGTWDRKQVITCFIFVIFGSMTLYFHNPIFVKWKPTIVFWIFSIVILFTQFFTAKPLMQRFLETMVQENHSVPMHVWKNLNIIWAVFFFVLGMINLYIAYYLSNNAWVNFKFYGITGALLLLSIFQALYLMRYISEDK